jgi:sugar lactone lactonase YvrE
MSAIVKTALAAATALVLAAPAAAGPFPDTIPLPTGFQPEGIAIGRGTTFYVGSIPTGAIFRGDLRTGTGEILVPPQEGGSAIGLAVDRRNRVFVAGGTTGGASVYDGETGARLAAYELTDEATTFVNDVVRTRNAAWFTDSFRPVLYRVPVPVKGTLEDPVVRELALSGDFVQGPDFNLNGIDATPDGKTLVVVQSNTGMLFRVDPRTGVADAIELTGGDVAFGDGILLEGTTLYVVQNQLNRVAVIELAPDLGSGTIVGHLTDPALDVPTTIDRFGHSLYAVNARFGVADPATAEYDVVRLPA